MWPSNRAFWDECFQLARHYGARYPELAAAQCCLESGFGRHTSGKNNFLGIKGQGTSTATQEWYDGQWVTINAGFIDFVLIHKRTVLPENLDLVGKYIAVVKLKP